MTAKEPEHGQTALIAGGLLSAAIAALHVVILFVGPRAYRYFGAGEEMARRAESGSPFPALLTAAVALLFAGFAFYALAAGSLFRRPALLRTGLVAIGVVYLARGLLLAPQAWAYLAGSPFVAARELVFSATALLAGCLYLGGTWRAWSSLRPLQRRAS